MTMRVPAAFIFNRSSVVTGLGASDMRGRQRVELHDLALPEVAVLQLRVWHGELRSGDDAVAEANDVQVEGTGPPALPAFAPRFHLDREAMLHQRQRLERRHEQHHLIEVRLLLHRAKGSRFLDARSGDEM